MLDSSNLSSNRYADSLPRSADAVLIGAGLIGLSIAWKLAERGLSTCVLDESPLSGASRVGAGMLAPVTEVHYGEVPLLGLNLESAKIYPRFLEELSEVSSIDPDYRPGGILLVAKDGDDKAVLDELAEYQLSLGLEAEPLTASMCRQIEPLLSPGLRGGVYAKSDATIDNRKLGAALLEAATRKGAIVAKLNAEAVLIENERAVGVEAKGGQRISAGTVILAAGCHSPEIGGIPPELVPPVRPVKGQLMILAKSPTAPPIQVTTRGLVHGKNVYLVARSDGRVVVGGTVEEMGYDTRVTAGAMLDLLQDAFELFPTIVEYELVEVLAGLRPGSPDNAPLIGEAGIKGLIYATGHYRNGILLTPATAYAVADIVVDGKSPDYASPFSPLRFLGSSR